MSWRTPSSSAISKMQLTGAEADSAAPALAMLKAGQQIDIVITDIQLKGAPTGWDVAEAFRAAQPTMPVIYASGNTPDASRRVPESLFFRKPYDPAAILRSCQGFTQIAGVGYDRLVQGA